MLNVPEEIKTLYKTDGINKNLRITFPNGELPDINNDQILYESLSFKESACSQEAFKFGLCEAAEISFETVGIENMINMEIMAYIEIDVKSLRVWNDSFQKYVNNFSGRYVSDDDNLDRSGDEVEREVYSIPLGKFTVSSCPRSQSDMTHRQVTAYSKTFNTNDDMGQFPNWLISQLHKTQKIEKDGTVSDSTGTFTMYLPQFMEMCCARNNWTADYNATRINTTDGSPYSLKNLDKGDNAYNKNKFVIAPNVYLYASATNMGVMGKNDTLTKNPKWKLWDTPNMYTMERWYADNPDDYSYESFESQVVQTCMALNISIAVIDLDVIKEFYDNYLFGFVIAYSANVYSFVKHDGSDRPFCFYDDGLASKGRIQFHSGVYVENRATSTSQLAYSVYFKRTKYVLSPNSKLKQVNLLIDSNLTTEDGTYKFSFYNAFTFKDIMASYLELHALFGNQERDGTYTWFRLSKRDPMLKVEIPASLYKNLWYDEYEVDNIGHVLYSFKDIEDNETEVSYSLYKDQAIGYTVTSIYDMRENKVLELLSYANTTKQQTAIETLIENAFKAHVPLVKFIPIDAELVGLPYVEDGDYILITLPDKTAIESFILSRTMSGIQNLTDDITSSSGEIISDDEYQDPDSGDN